ncbi:pyridoxal kinase [Cardinium endosymbiont of Tipula unca]|uniref:pyridoxal kinase n=1 Tax=Cardinium endosymbiont of Tipula unca TaxID=3066216 RepID=UPI0030D56589
MSIDNANFEEAMGILSIQSHVVYGYVGNKAALYPLQSMGYDVWPVNTVQFSNHTGYKKWRGDIFSREHIRNIIKGIEELGILSKCRAILSGYMGSDEICHEVIDTVHRFKCNNSSLLYLCDPVIGSPNCYVEPEVLNFFKTNLVADIITPNQFEAEILSGIKIRDTKTLILTSQYFHNIGIKVVVITGLKLPDISDTDLHVFASDGEDSYIIKTKDYNFPIVVHGTGDLFSAIYLGSYILTKSIIKSLQISVYYTDKALCHTLEARTRELQVTEVDYRIANITTLPRFTKI